jgi:hypothetical protein
MDGPPIATQGAIAESAVEEFYCLCDVTPIGEDPSFECGRDCGLDEEGNQETYVTNQYHI